MGCCGRKMELCTAKLEWNKGALGWRGKLGWGGRKLRWRKESWVGVERKDDVVGLGWRVRVGGELGGEGGVSHSRAYLKQSILPNLRFLILSLT